MQSAAGTHFLQSDARIGSQVLALSFWVVWNLQLTRYNSSENPILQGTARLLAHSSPAGLVCQHIGRPGKPMRAAVVPVFFVEESGCWREGFPDEGANDEASGEWRRL